MDKLLSLAVPVMLQLVELLPRAVHGKKTLREQKDKVRNKLKKIEQGKLASRKLTMVRSLAAREKAVPKLYPANEEDAFKYFLFLRTLSARSTVILKTASKISSRVSLLTSASTVSSTGEGME